MWHVTMFDRVVDDGKGFLRLLKEYNTYIGGICMPSSKSESFLDLELYFHEQAGARAILAWHKFLTGQGYELEKVGKDHSLTGSGRVGSW